MHVIFLIINIYTYIFVYLFIYPQNGNSTRDDGEQPFGFLFFDLLLQQVVLDARSVDTADDAQNIELPLGAWLLQRQTKFEPLGPPNF